MYVLVKMAEQISVCTSVKEYYCLGKYGEIVQKREYEKTVAGTRKLLPWLSNNEAMSVS